jgi:hypothetical protein
MPTVRLNDREGEMAELFSADWMQGFMARWNADPDLAGALAETGFSSVIGYGFDGEAEPRGVLKVEGGRGVAAGSYAGENLNWDLRASAEQWAKWMKRAPGMMSLGMAYNSGKLKFQVGDYAAMIKDPYMAGPFIKSFSAMSRV